MIVEKQTKVNLLNHQKKIIDIIDLNHPLVQLSNSLDWESIQLDFKEIYKSTTGHPAKPIRLMVGLHYLRYMFNLSDESIVWAYIENPYYQYFCGEEVFRHDFPIDRSSMSRFRQRLKKKKLFSLLQETIKSGFKTKVIKPKSIEKCVIDSTVQEKNIAYPTDAKLYYKAIIKLSKLSKDLGITLRQSYTKTAKKMLIQYGRYNHAKQFKRKAKTLSKLKNRLGRVYREVLRKIDNAIINIPSSSLELLYNIKRLLTQKRNSKNKIYSLHESDVVCISKGKSHKRYEFGNKSSFITTSKECFIIQANALKGNPYDGHTLKDELLQAKINIKSLTEKTINKLYTDKGYTGHNYKGDTIVLKETSSNRKKDKTLKRRSSIEPIIGHLKQDHRLGRNFLKGRKGNDINTILAACGFNLRKIYNKFKKEWLKYIFLLFFMLFYMTNEKKCTIKTQL